MVREPLLKKIIDNYSLSWAPEEKNRFLTDVLDLRRPAHADRVFQDQPLCTASLGCDGVLHPLCCIPRL
jgi:hypothetical protein